MNKLRLENRTALITGGGSGIGKATAELFLREGAAVVITGRDEAKLRTACSEFSSLGRISYRPCDLTHCEQVRDLITWATRELGRIDILVNNAGANIKRRAMRELTPESYRFLIEANLDSAFYCTHFVLPQMLERKDGVLIFVSSTAGKRAGPLGGGAYGAAKSGMAFLSHALGIEEKDNGIRCSVIYPGEVDTPILENRPQPVPPEHRARILKPEDVAEAIAFVASLPPRASVPELIIKPTCQAYS
ncbi:MAG: SDR family oxidoreductase [Gemmatales bacterium]|nr:SDR family oxidoreductase [Gemmatales bacterium]MDW8387616.1 SDR family oxidoreductase [Gemmatales bacterium]